MRALLVRLILPLALLSILACGADDDDDGLLPNGCRWRGAVVRSGKCFCPVGTVLHDNKECIAADAAAAPHDASSERAR